MDDPGVCLSALREMGFTAADIMMTFPFTPTRLFLEYDRAPFPKILAYLKRIEARPAYRKAMALVGSKGDVES